LQEIPKATTNLDQAVAIIKEAGLEITESKFLKHKKLIGPHLCCGSGAGFNPIRAALASSDAAEPGSQSLQTDAAARPALRPSLTVTSWMGDPSGIQG